MGDQTDLGLAKVAGWLQRNADAAKIALAIRTAIDDVVEGYKNGKPRTTINDLEKTEKTFIGTRVEMRIIQCLGLIKNNLKEPDTTIEGHPVDIKCTIKKAWMIPSEAVNQLCLLVCLTDTECSIGLIRAVKGVLSQGVNKDQKHTLRCTHPAIKWILKSVILPESLVTRRITLIIEKDLAASLKSRFGPSWVLDEDIASRVSGVLGAVEIEEDLRARKELLAYLRRIISRDKT